MFPHRQARFTITLPLPNSASEMKTLLLLALLTMLQAQPLSNTDQAFRNEVQMRMRYNEMLAALQDFAVASDAFCVIVNGGTQWPLKEGRTVELKAAAFTKAWSRVYDSAGWISVRKIEGSGSGSVSDLELRK